MQSILNYSIVVPVYRNEENIRSLLGALAGVTRRLGSGTEVVFVVDGSPDRSLQVLTDLLPAQSFASTLVPLTRNFGAFAAIRHGLGVSKGQAVAVMAADLQEPPELILELLGEISSGADVAFGVRTARSDPFLSKLLSSVFWRTYRACVMPEIPAGGVDIFALSDEFRDRLLALPEGNTSLLAQLFWLGGNRILVPYQRRAREVGTSAWTFSKKVKYLTDSIYSFTDLPIRFLTYLGVAGVVVSALMGVGVLAAKLTGHVEVPGYAATVLVVLFFGAFNALGLGIIGNYVWRAFENTKGRPLSLSGKVHKFNYPEPDRTT